MPNDPANLLGHALDTAAKEADNGPVWSGTFCAVCRAHFPVGPIGEFRWVEDDSKVGT